MAVSRASCEATWSEFCSEVCRGGGPVDPGRLLRGVSLLAGQGAAVTLAASYVLADELQRARAIEQALFRYQARLKPVVARKQAAGRRVAHYVIGRPIEPRSG